MTDPRVCKTAPPDFDHLSLAEIAEMEDINRRSHRRWSGGITMREGERYLELHRRRVDPDRGRNNGNAA